MVRGLETFKHYFATFPSSYIIIGGTAADILLSNAALTPRATKDIDIILIVEALSTDFVKQFWTFIKDGAYEKKEQSEDERKYYRFTKPANSNFPYQIELFSRKPDLITLDPEIHITPIPVEDDLSSLSAILLNDDYYSYMIEHSIVEDGIRYANPEALICLKAKAYLEIRERMEKGIQEDVKNLNKHKNDIFRLALLFNDESQFQLPELLYADFTAFMELIKGELPDKAIYKAMGASGESQHFADRLQKTFFYQ